MTQHTINFLESVQAATGVSQGMVRSVLIFIILLLVGAYVFQALAWQTIAKRLGYKRPWLAWIPVANMAMILQLGSFHWAWALLIFASAIPIIGDISQIAVMVLFVIAQWRIFEKEDYKGWLSILTLIPVVGLVVIGIVAWRKKKNAPEIIQSDEPVKKIVKKIAKKTTKKKVVRKAKK